MNPISCELFVLDTETTGLDGGPGDLVVDIGVCAVNLATGRVRDVYSAVLGYDISRWNNARRGAWVFRNTDLTLEDVAEAQPADGVIDDVRHLLTGRVVASYNEQFDFSRFLYREPWSMRGIFLPAEDIMLASCAVEAIPRSIHDDRSAWPRLAASYAYLCGEDDPAGIGGVQDHRALSDARVASYVALRLANMGLYSMPLPGRLCGRCGE